MKLIIDIDENVYTRLFDNGIQDNEIATDDICEMARALRLGKPLTVENLREDIEQLPSVRPQEPKIGHWLYSGENGVDRWTCDNCFDFVKKPTKVCQNCGARMVEPQGSEG